jgi:ABC-type sugar transport system permease subunit
VFYVLPALAFLVLVLLVPLGMTAGLSLTSWDGLGPIKWVGLSNYTALLSDPIVVTAMGNAVIMTVFTLAEFRPW